MHTTLTPEQIKAGSTELKVNHGACTGYKSAVLSAMLAIIIEATGLRADSQVRMLLTVDPDCLWQMASRTYSARPDAFEHLPIGIHEALTFGEHKAIEWGLMFKTASLPTCSDFMEILDASSEGLGPLSTQHACRVEAQRRIARQLPA